MPPAAKPANEEQRVAALHLLNLLDTPPEERFDRLTRLAKRLFDVPTALVTLIDTNRQWFKSRAGFEATDTPRNTSFCGHAILSDDLLLIDDARNDRRFNDNPFVTGAPYIRFYAGCPLVVNGTNRLGTFCLFDSKPRELDPVEQGLLRDLGQMAQQELLAVQLATTDELTGISNRRGFEVLAQHALNMCKRLGRRASLLFFDLNGFKEINDVYGHAEGDRALVAFADVLLGALRESDVVGRLGGDEFVALLTDSDEDGAARLLDRLREQLDRYNREAARGYDLRCSIGQASFSLDGDASIANMLATADRAMYADKRAGRGGVR
jgi:diguanylate cyclase (GGDEF)-like protein